MKKIIYSLIFLLVIGCSHNDEWVDIGTKNAEAFKDGESVKRIPYRLISYKTKDMGVIPTNVDMVDIAMDSISGKALGKLVLLPVQECWAPSVRDGIPTVMCKVQSRGDAYLTGDQEIRKQLLRLDGSKVGSVVGRIVGTYAETPIVLVL